MKMKNGSPFKVVHKEIHLDFFRELNISQTFIKVISSYAKSENIAVQWIVHIIK